VVLIPGLDHLCGHRLGYTLAMDAERLPGLDHRNWHGVLVDCWPEQVAMMMMMMMRALAIVFAVAGLVSWLWPGAIPNWLFPSVSARESEIIGAFFFVAAAILWFSQWNDPRP
jgi:hypothetical protein